MTLTYVRAHLGMTILTCLVIVLVYCNFFNIPEWISTDGRKTDYKTFMHQPQRMIFSKPEELVNNLEQYNKYKMHNLTLTKNIKIEQLNRTSERFDAKNISEKTFPHINPKFHVNLPNFKTDNHLILLWDVPDWLKKWVFATDINQCIEYKNCEQTLDQTLLKQSKAVVFNLPNKGTGQRPPVSPELRNPNQVWVFFTLESPMHINSDYKSPHWKHVFNWSWTYHPNADIFHPYGVLVEKEKIPIRNYTAIFRKKTRFIAWVVSNCNAPSRRNDYVKILKRYVDVDVFGKCGQKAPDNLDNFVSKNYKFYLGFENCICENYMTEKFFHYYKLDVITILRGKTDYHKYLPDGSYIDTANFTTIAALAQFLKQLGDDEVRYTSYLKIKDRFEVYEREFMYKNAVCNLCEKLNSQSQDKQIYADIISWLGKCDDAMDLNEENSAFDISTNATGI